MFPTSFLSFLLYYFLFFKVRQQSQKDFPVREEAKMSLFLLQTFSHQEGAGGVLFCRLNASDTAFFSSSVNIKRGAQLFPVFPGVTTSRTNRFLKGEVRRKMNFTYVLGFVLLRDVVKIFPVSSSSVARKTTRRNRARSHSGA